jgi:hypothetical protein
MDRAVVQATLESCLLTDAELAAGPAGWKAFVDPFSELVALDPEEEDDDGWETADEDEDEEEDDKEDDEAETVEHVHGEGCDHGSAKAVFRVVRVRGEA